MQPVIAINNIATTRGNPLVHADTENPKPVVSPDYYCTRRRVLIC
jgi:hypothetical protein